MKRHKELLHSFAEVTPFALPILSSFIIIGNLALQKGLDLFKAIFFTAFVMSAPLQIFLLEGNLASFGLLSITIYAFSINLRFFVYTMSIRENLRGSIWNHILPLSVMGNSAFVLLSSKKLRSKNISPTYTNAICMSLYILAIVGTFIGYKQIPFIQNFLSEHALIILSLFIAANLGKISQRYLKKSTFVLIASLLSTYIMGGINLLFMTAFAFIIGEKDDR